jgi:4-amino-4-deoxy-L-arabinose transferase-like glycosyltransferase
MQPTSAANLINWSAFAAALVGLFALSRLLRIRGTPWIVAAFAVWAPNYYLIRAARPDPIVIALSLLALCAMAHYVRRPAWRPLLAAGLLCSVAAATRYMALLTLVPVFAVAVAMTRTRWQRRLTDLGLFGVIAITPVAAWITRNIVLTGHMTGIPRTGGREFMQQFGLLGNVWGLLKTVAIDAFGFGAIGIRWVVYGEQPLPFPLAVLGGSVAMLAMLAVVAWRGREEIRRHLKDEVMAHDLSRGALVVTVTHAILYLVVLLAVWTLSNNDPIETRYASPLYPALMLGVGGLLGAASNGLPRGAVLAAAFGVVVFIAGPNLLKSISLMTGDPPPSTLMPATIIEPHFRNWVEPFTWDEVGQWQR